jgi:hypothetical protein
MALAIALNACATAPKRTAASLRVAANPPATVEGIVRDESGDAVPGIGVRGIPGARDVLWTPVVETGCDGRFRLTLPAPASYTFFLVWRGTGVLTPDPRDPSHVTVTVSPGAVVGGVELLFLASQWKAAAARDPGAPASPCPQTPVYNSPR